MATIACPECRRDNPSDSRFCQACGTGLPLVCSHCSRENTADAAFCVACGSSTRGVASLTLTNTQIPHEQEDSIPTSFDGGRYAVRELLGEGATKIVYLAHDSLLDRDIAFALIKSAGLDDADRARILREAQTMARLGDHPNIVQIFEFGQEAGQPFMVLPVMEGGTLEDLVSKAAAGEVEFDTVLRVALDVCSGLEYAHSKQVIHRDLKPGNVWLTAEGVAKIGDFGIAFSPARTRVTQTGLLLGTVAYMPPEQAMGASVDARSDLYSFGAMLFELVTGNHPFPGENPVAIISQHINAPPLAPTRYNPRCPAELEEPILGLLAKEPDDRPQSAADVASALEAIRSTVIIPPAGSVVTEAPTQPLRVLIVDDSDEDAAVLIRELRRGGYDATFERVDRALSMNNALETQEWDIVIADYSMPHFSAPAALKVMQLNGLDLPFIIASRQISEEIAVEAMKSGAHDYVMKDNLARLNPAVERELQEAMVRRARTVKEKEERQVKEQLEERVRELTELNARFQRQQKEHLEMARSYRELLEGLQKLPDGLQKIAQEAFDLVARARAQPIPELPDDPAAAPNAEVADADR